MNFKSRLPTRKLYYVPGLISLVFIPIIFLNLANSYKKFTVLQYAVPLDTPSTNLYSFSGPNFLNEIKYKKIIHFYLDGNHELNKKKFDIIRPEALKLKFTYDTSHVIMIHFSDSICYGEFIYLLNMMKIDDHKRYVGWKNSFYILGDGLRDPENEIELLPDY